MSPNPRNRHWRIFGVSAAVLLLIVQVGLSIHGASHLHVVDQVGGCQLCVLNSHFVVELCAALDLDPVRLVVALHREDAAVPADSTGQTPTARGPPVVSV